MSGRAVPPPCPSRRLRFDVLVPAHNESAVIENCLASLRKIDWPAPLFRLLVVADNCDDATAVLAADAGALVLVRTDPTRKGKGFALQYGFEHSRAAGWADAVAIVDADSEVSANILEAFAARLENGAGAVQAHYGVLNPLQSWRTRLMAIAHGAFHGVRSRARERLELSSGIRGNGWCVAHAVLEENPFQAFSLTEDIEYGIDLGLSGYRVHYADEAWANAEMAAGEQVASRQRQRWEDGRMDLFRSRTVPLLQCAWRQRSLVCIDLAIDLMMMPLSYVVLYVTALIAISAALSVWNAAFLYLLWLAVLLAAVLTLYVFRGWQLSGLGAVALLDVLRAPFFVVWKLLLKLRRYDRTEWAPTRRRGP
nr:glycosyltransferase family 2 protein [Lysobacter sp. CAU 1642]